MAKKVRRRNKATKKQRYVPQAIVSDQSSSFTSVVIDTGTVVASLKLPPGSWVIFATVALAAATSALGTTVVETMFTLDGKLFGQEVQTDFMITNTGSSISGFGVVPLTTGSDSRQAENSAGRVHGYSGEHGLVSADDDHRYPSGIGYAYHVTVRYTPKADSHVIWLGCPLWANSGHWRLSFIFS